MDKFDVVWAVRKAMESLESLSGLSPEQVAVAGRVIALGVEEMAKGEGGEERCR